MLCLYCWKHKSKCPGILCKSLEEEIAHILKLGFFYKVMKLKSSESTVIITLDRVDNLTEFESGVLLMD